MQVKEIIDILTNLEKDDILNIMLDGSDYGEIVAIVKHKGKYLVCNQLEYNRRLGEEVTVNDNSRPGKEEKQD